MTPISGTNRIVVLDDDSIALRSKAGRQTTYLLLFALLAAAAAFGFEPARDLSGSRLIGTIAFAIASLALLAVGGLSSSIVFDRRRRRCSKKTTLFSIEISSTAFELGTEARVVLQDVELVKRPESSGERAGLLAGFLTARTHLYRLFLVIDSDTANDADVARIKLEETTYPEGIDELGKTIAEYLGIRFESESL